MIPERIAMPARWNWAPTIDQVTRKSASRAFARQIRQRTAPSKNGPLTRYFLKYLLI
jgi:hypothetical protein